MVTQSLRLHSPELCTIGPPPDIYIDPCIRVYISVYIAMASTTKNLVSMQACVGDVMRTAPITPTVFITEVAVPVVQGSGNFAISVNSSSVHSTIMHLTCQDVLLDA